MGTFRNVRPLLLALIGAVACSASCSSGSPGEHLGHSAEAVRPGAKLVRVEIQPGNIRRLLVGETVAFHAIGHYSDRSTADLTDLVTWRVSNPALAKVSNSPGSKGTVTTMSAGTETLTFTFNPSLIPLVAVQHIPPAVLTFIITLFRPAVVTEHNDNQRTGANLDETVLTPDSVKNDGLTLRYSYPVDGQIVGQPLYVPGVAFRKEVPSDFGLTPITEIRDVVYVATQANWLYALDANATSANDAVIKAVYLGYPPAKTTVGGTTPFTGIFSTPVIDRRRGVIYLVAKEGSPDSYGTGFHVLALHLDIGTSLVSSYPNYVQGYASPTIDGNTTVRKLGGTGTVTFDPAKQNQRPALLLAKSASNTEHLVVAFGGQPNDAPRYGGYVFVYDYDLQFDDAIATNDDADGTPDAAGIWQSGNGPASDGEGNMYIATGNLRGFNASDQNHLGSSVLQLHLNTVDQLRIRKEYIDDNSLLLNGEDMDLSSAGVLMLPWTGILANAPYRVLASGKDGLFRVFDPPKASEKSPPLPWSYSQKFQATFSAFSCLPALCGCIPDPNDPTHKKQLCGSRARDKYPQIHGTPVYWNGHVYVWAQRDYLRALRYDSASSFPTISDPTLYDNCTGCPDVGCAAGTACLSGAGYSVECQPGACNLALGAQLGNDYSLLAASTGMAGGMLSISSDGDTDGILWVAMNPSGDSEGCWEPGILRAFRPNPWTVATGSLCCRKSGTTGARRTPTTSRSSRRRPWPTARCFSPATSSQIRRSPDVAGRGSVALEPGPRRPATCRVS